MSRGKFEVDTRLLHSGSDSSEFAGAAAQKAANRLADASMQQGIFGEFAAAESFQRALATARDDHVQRSQDHHARLKSISGKGHIGAQAVDDTDAGVADAIASAGG